MNTWYGVAFTKENTFAVTIGSATVQNVVVIEPKAPAVPGFEALFLVGAIGIAFWQDKPARQSSGCQKTAREMLLLRKRK